MYIIFAILFVFGNTDLLMVDIPGAGIRGGTSYIGQGVNVFPDLDARGENRSLPSHFSMASIIPYGLTEIR